MSQHAIVPRDGYRVPIIGIPAEAALETCDLCGEVLPIDALIFTGSQMLCGKCREPNNERQNP